MSKSLLNVLVVLLIAFPIFGFSQSRQITGTVLTSTGEPLPFATVILKGSNTGTSANELGKFSINVPGSNGTLVISSSGYAPIELQLGPANDYSITLNNAGQLNEVVVTTLGNAVHLPERRLSLQVKILG